MNKFAFLLGLLLIFNLSKSEDEDQMSTLYDHATYIIEGMSRGGEGQCVAVLRNNKSQLLKILNDIIADMKNGDDLSTIVVRYLGKLIVIDGLTSKCNIFNILGVVDLFNSATGISDLGNSIVSNAQQIFSFIQELKTKETLDEKLVPVGHILALILNFYVS